MKKIKLERGGLEAIVDDQDFERASNHRWYPDYRKNGTIYVKGTVDGKQVRLHRFILELSPGVGHVDHEDGDGLNNSRSNLKFCTRDENVRNGRVHGRSASGYRGVYKRRDRWVARLIVGTFDTQEEASAAYVKAFQAYFGYPPRHPSRGK